MSNNKPGCLGFILQALGILPQIGDTLSEDSLPYAERDDFLSSAELSFYKLLVQTVGDRVIICPKVSLKDIFFVKTKDRRDFYTYNNKIHLKHVDFLICTKDTLKPICGIELDDLSHKKQDRIKRDEFVDKVFQVANLRLVRFANKKSYTINEIEEKIKPIFETKEIPSDEIVIVKNNEDEEQIPICKKCGIPMVLRIAKKGANAGQEFYGCTNYPKCKETKLLR
jgi:hypothetical protein